MLSVFHDVQFSAQYRRSIPIYLCIVLSILSSGSPGILKSCFEHHRYNRLRHLSLIHDCIRLYLLFTIINQLTDENS